MIDREYVLLLLSLVSVVVLATPIVFTEFKHSATVCQSLSKLPLNILSGLQIFIALFMMYYVIKLKWESSKLVKLLYCIPIVFILISAFMLIKFVNKNFNENSKCLETDSKEALTFVKAMLVLNIIIIFMVLLVKGLECYRDSVVIKTKKRDKISADIEKLNSIYKEQFGEQDGKPVEGEKPAAEANAAAKRASFPKNK
jgi:hypothetical protein